MGGIGVNVCHINADMCFELQGIVVSSDVYGPCSHRY